MAENLTTVAGTPLVSDQADSLDWSYGARGIARADSYWLATRHTDGRPHVMPVLAVWADDAIYFCTSDASRKGKNLREHQDCVLSASAAGYDFVLEGTAQRITDESALRRVADAYEAKYGWRVAVRDGLFQDTEGAPAAGSPPYDVYAISPHTAFAFGTSDETESAATRWRFA